MTALLLLCAVLAAWMAIRTGRTRGERTGERIPLTIELGRRLLVLGQVPDPRWAAGRPELDRAGLGRTDPRSEIEAWRLGSTAMAAACAVSAMFVAPGLLMAVLGVGLVAVGWTQPELQMRAMARRRRAAIDREAPVVVDLVSVCVASGVGLDTALQRAADAASGPLAEELDRTMTALRLGATRAEELRSLVRRTGSPVLERLAAAIRLSALLGVPIAAELEQQARAARREQAYLVAERAAAAGPRMLLVVVLVLVPAALIPVLTAVGLSVADAFTFA
jgi:tight adherence protein C